MPVREDIEFRKNALLNQLKELMEAVEAASTKDITTFTQCLDSLIQNVSSLIQNPVHKKRLITYLLTRFKHKDFTQSIPIAPILQQDYSISNFHLSSSAIY